MSHSGFPWRSDPSLSSGPCREATRFSIVFVRPPDGDATQGAARGRAAQQTLDISFTRDKFVFVPGDIIFVLAGDIEDEDNPDASCGCHRTVVGAPGDAAV